MFDAIFRGASHSAGPALEPVPATLARPEGVRHYLVAAPPHTPAGKRPLVVVLHGGGASARQVMGLAFPPSPLSVWLEIAARENLVVAAPDAGKGGWSDGLVPGRHLDRKDDVAFIDALIERAIAGHGVDPDRVYLIGVSRGGWMAYRTALAIPHRLAAFSAVLAGMPLSGPPEARPTPLSALIVASAADPIVRYGGGRHWYAPPFMRAMRGVEASAAYWRELAGLPDVAEVVRMARRHPWDKTSVTRVTWGDDPHACQVVLYRVDGGGHAEPSALKRYPRFINWMTGRQNADVETAGLAWDFFRTKRRAPARTPDGPVSQPVHSVS